MPIKKKLIKLGNSRVVVIPQDWLKYYEEKQGIEVQDVLMELNNVITIAVEIEGENLAAEEEK